MTWTMSSLQQPVWCCRHSDIVTKWGHSLQMPAESVPWPKKRQALQNRRIMRPGFHPPIAFCRSPSVASALWQKVTTERDSWQRQRERELGVEKALEMWNRLPTKGCILHPSGCQHRWTHHRQYYCVTCGLTEANAVFHRKSQKEVTVLAGFTSHTLHHCDDVGKKKKNSAF